MPKTGSSDGERPTPEAIQATLDLLQKGAQKNRATPAEAFALASNLVVEINSK